MSASILAVLRTFLALGFIIALIVVLSRAARKRQAGGPLAGAGARIDVVTRRSLGQRSNLLVVRVADRTFLLGQSAQHTTLLADLSSTNSPLLGTDQTAPHSTLTSLTSPAPRMATGTGDESPGAWDALIDRLREKTVRH